MNQFPGFLQPQAVAAGLEALVDLEHILIEQHIESLEWFASIEAANKYTIKSPEGQIIFHAEEHSNFFARNLIGKSRGFVLKVHTPDQREVFSVKRYWKCGLFACCSPKCLERMEISTPSEPQLGTVIQVFRCCSGVMYFSVNDADGETVLKVQVPNKMSCCSDMEFEVVDELGQVIGEIRKKWSGFAQELFTQADNFGVTFPKALPVNQKVLLISVCVLIVSLEDISARHAIQQRFASPSRTLSTSKRTRRVPLLILPRTRT